MLRETIAIELKAPTWMLSREDRERRGIVSEETIRVSPMACGGCYGSGRVVNDNYLADYTECPVCGGTGRLAAEVTVSWKRTS